MNKNARKNNSWIYALFALDDSSTFYLVSLSNRTTKLPASPKYLSKSLHYPTPTPPTKLHSQGLLNIYIYIHIKSMWLWVKKKTPSRPQVLVLIFLLPNRVVFGVPGIFDPLCHVYNKAPVFFITFESPDIHRFARSWPRCTGQNLGRRVVRCSGEVSTDRDKRLSAPWGNQDMKILMILGSRHGKMGTWPMQRTQVSSNTMFDPWPLANQHDFFRSKNGASTEQKETWRPVVPGAS